MKRLDPEANEWFATTKTTLAHSGGTLTTLARGTVLVVGGSPLYGSSAPAGPFAAEIYDQSTDTWTLLPNRTHRPRRSHTATRFSSSKVLVAGGYPAIQGTEVFTDLSMVCKVDTDCAPDEYCKATACTPKGVLGAACTAASECASSLCVDGVCCNAACGGPCEACSAASKGSGADGTCGNVAAGTNPRAGCVADPGFPASCKADGLCDGAGACRVFATPTTACGATTCVAGKVDGKFCSGAGACESVVGRLCTPYACDATGTACRTSCSDDTHCAATLTCDADGRCG